MHTIEIGKEVVCFSEINESPIFLKIEENKVLFSKEVLLSGTNEKAELIILEKDNPSQLISERVNSCTAPSTRVFIHTECQNFVQGQKFYAAIVKERVNESIKFIPCIVLNIIPNGYIH